jgi:photosystem II stability/assembly factor-like uncharacterized protein
MRSRWFPFSMAATLVLACASPALAQTWTAVGPPGGLTVRALLPDPSVSTTIYAGTSSNGVFVSTDSGGSWNASNSGLASLSVTAFAAFQPGSPPGVPPVSPYVFAGTSDAGVFLSLSRGASWVAASNGLSNLSVSALAMSSTGVLYAGTQGGVFKSVDNGSSWTAVNSGLLNPIVVCLAIDPSNPSVLFAGVLGAIYRTTNAGASWSPVFTTASDRVSAIAVDPSSSSTVYAGTVFAGVLPPGTDPSGTLVKSTNGGTAWTAAVNGLPSIGVAAIAIDRTATARIYIGTAGAGSFVTKTFGASWTAQSSGLSDRHVTAMTVAQTSPSTVYAGTQTSGVFRAVSDAVGVAWSVPSQGTSGLGQAIPLSSDTGTFWFFDSANYELMIKVLDGRTVNGHIWVFYGALSNVQYTITVTDTQTGAIKNYTNASGTLASVADVLAF